MTQPPQGPQEPAGGGPNWQQGPPNQGHPTIGSGSQMPPGWTGPGAPVEYYASHQRDSAATLVRLALIFNFICLGFDALAVLGGLVLAIVFGTGVIPRGPDDPPSWVMGLLFAGGTMLFSAFSTGKFVAMWRVKKRRPNAWAWGLAAGIAGCVQIMCGFYCCLQVATGIFTVVVFALGNVRNYLAEETVQ